MMSLVFLHVLRAFPLLILIVLITTKSTGATKNGSETSLGVGASKAGGDDLAERINRINATMSPFIAEEEDDVESLEKFFDALKVVQRENGLSGRVRSFRDLATGNIDFDTKHLRYWPSRDELITARKQAAFALALYRYLQVKQPPSPSPSSSLQPSICFSWEELEVTDAEKGFWAGQLPHLSRPQLSIVSANEVGQQNVKEWEAAFAPDEGELAVVVMIGAGREMLADLVDSLPKEMKHRIALIADPHEDEKYILEGWHSIEIMLEADAENPAPAAEGVKGGNKETGDEGDEKARKRLLSRKPHLHCSHCENLQPLKVWYFPRSD